MPSPSPRRSTSARLAVVSALATAVLVPAVLLPAAAGPAAAASGSVVAPGAGSVLFTSEVGWYRNLLSLDPATGERTSVWSPTEGRFDSLHDPAVSPDQTRVALLLDPGNDPKLVVRDLRSGAVTTLAGRGAFPPEWLPDGSAVLAALDVQQLDGQYARDVHRFPVGAAGTPSQAAVKLPGTSGLAHVSVNPAGDTLVASDFRTGELVRQRLDGSERVVLGRGQHPRWSPDGTLVVYSVYDPAGIGSRSLRVMEPSGQGDRLLVGAAQLATLEVSGSTGRPSWSPDSAQVLFDVTPGAAPSGNGDLFRVGRDGTGLTRLTVTPDVDEREPAVHLGLPADPPAPSPDPSPTAVAGTPPTVTVPAAPISAGQRVTVTYRGRPGDVLEVLSRTQPSTTFTRITTVTLGADGTGQTSHAPQRNTRMAARVAGGPMSTTQPVIAVRSVASLNVARTGTRSYAFAGRVYPARDQRLVSLYRDGRLLAQGRTGADGVYRLTRTLPAGTAAYEVRTSDDTWNLGTRSPLRRFAAV